MAGDAAKAGVFNNAAQVWNHTFFWKCMKPGGGGAPTGAVADAIDAAFGGFEQFVADFKAAAVGRFGSGWAWLVADGDAVKIVTTPNAETPLTARPEAAAHRRRLGARLLPRLPEPAPRLRAGVLRQARQLGVRQREPRLTLVRRHRPVPGDRARLERGGGA